MVCGYAHPLYDEDLFKDWKRYTYDGHADGQSKGTVAREEVLWLNAVADHAYQLRRCPLFEQAS